MNLAKSIEILPIILSDQISKRSRNNLRGHLQPFSFKIHDNTKDTKQSSRLPGKFCVRFFWIKEDRMFVSLYMHVSTCARKGLWSKPCIKYLKSTLHRYTTATKTMRRKRRSIQPWWWAYSKVALYPIHSTPGSSLPLL